jgi:L,D-transpeptidase catalytic domain/Bacterial Ig-like domain
VLSGGRVGRRVAARGAYFSRSGNRVGGAPADLGSGGGAGEAPAGQAAPPDRPGGDDGKHARFEGRRGRSKTRVIAAVTAVVALLAGGGVYLLTNSGGSSPSAGVTLPGPFRVMSVTPAAGSTDANGTLPVRVEFSAPPAGRSPKPVLTPSVPGIWQIIGDAMVFTPRTAFSPSTRITVSVPSGRGGVRSAAGRNLGRPATAGFTTGAYSSLRMAELLAQLGYLPMSWQLPNLDLQAESAVNLAKTGLTGQIGAAFDPPAGTFAMDPGYPASLDSLFAPEQGNVVLRGAVMAFQSEHNMTVNGTVNLAFWLALFKAAMTGQVNAHGYTYAVASQVDPETLTVYHNGHVVLKSLANTGIPSSPTANGTFPVYEKFLQTWMSGTNPDGSHYHDLVQYVSYFNGGDAVHYFARGAYGFQQSLGCVELPFTQAKEAYPYLTLGSLVHVTG